VYFERFVLFEASEERFGGWDEKVGGWGGWGGDIPRDVVSSGRQY